MKERTPIICVEIREDTKIHWDPESNILKLLDSEGKVSKKHLVSISEGYARTGKGPKVLRQSRSPHGSLIDFPIKSVVHNKYLAIDTNYKELGNNLLCVTGCIFLNHFFNYKGQLSKGDKIEIVVAPRLIFLSAKNAKPERYGWMKMIESLLNSKYYDLSLSFGVVVDSDLNDLRKIENSEVELIPGFKLPPNINLIYASADVGKENLLNRLISTTDKMAACVLDSILEEAQKYTNIKLPKDYYDIETKNDEGSITLADLERIFVYKIK